MNEREEESLDEHVEIVNLDEQPFTFAQWRKNIFAALSRHKRAWIAVACISLCLLLILTEASIPVLRNNVWSKVSSIPLDAMSVQVKGRVVYSA
jgi:hypothetical protein